MTIRGPKEDVHRAKQMLVDLSNEKQLASYTTEVRPEALILSFLGIFVMQSKANFTKHLHVAVLRRESLHFHLDFKMHIGFCIIELKCDICCAYE